MKKILLFIASILFFSNSSIANSKNLICQYIGFNCPNIDSSELIVRDGLYYKKFSIDPFTGSVIGKKKGSVINGNKDGNWFIYFEDGHIKEKKNYIEGKLEGVFISYYENGQLNTKGNYNNNNQEGEWVIYDYNGNLLL